MLEFKEMEDCRRRSFKAVAAIRDISALEKLIPVAFPVCQSTWSVRLGVEKSTGLVDRYLLTAVKEFGPILASRIGAMMWLPTGVVENTLCKLSKLGVPLQRTAAGWQLAADADIESHQVVQVHDFGFISNGLTGNFLPLSQANVLRSSRLDEMDVERLHLLPMRPRRMSAEGEITRKIIESSRAYRFAEFGIPDGYRGFVEKVPRSESVRLVLAFMFVFKDGDVAVLSGSESAFSLECPKEIAADYLKDFGGHVPTPGAYAGVSFSDKGNVRHVKVEDAHLWGGDFPPGDANARSARFVRAMVYPGWTCDHDGSFHRLVPQDSNTAHSLALYRGCSLLRRSYKQIKTTHDLFSAAEEYSEECRREIPGLKTLPPFKDVLNVALQSSDGNLAEWAKEIVPRVPKTPEATSSTCVFHSSNECRFEDVLIRALDTAKDSIMLVSPVLDEDAVFKALERALDRGVRDILVITQLTNHRNSMFRTDPQFENYELPRRKLAALGVSVRDCAYTVHAKLVVVDSAWMLFTSANLNANGLGVGKTNALEVALEYTGARAAQVGETMFRTIWGSASFRQVRMDDRISITALPGVRDVGLSACIQACQGYDFFLSTPENQLLARKLCTLFTEAKEEIIIATMSFYDLEVLPSLFKAMEDALKRGVKIKVCVRPGVEMNFSPSEWPDTSTIKLKNAGLLLFEREHLHAKGVVVDRKQVLMTSANFNPFSLGCSKTAHIEMAVVGSVVLKPLAEFARFVAELFTSVA